MITIILLQTPSSSFIAPIVAATISAIVSIGSVAVSYYMNRKALQERRVEEKRKYIYVKLDEFYGPFQQQLNKSSELFKILKKDKPADFRTLTYLLNPEQEYSNYGKVVFTPNDKIILSEIIEVGKKLEELILTKAGLVDDPRLSSEYKPSKEVTDVEIKTSEGLLALLGTHLLLVRHAYIGSISGEMDRYKNYVFPKEIYQVIRENINRLNKELDSL